MKNAILFAILLIAFNGYTQITCPDDITINCDQDYTDTLVIGSPIIADSINIDDVSIDFTTDLNACNAGTVSVIYSLSDTAVCTQMINVINPFSELDSTTIIFPSDTMYINCNRTYEHPIWSGADCDFIGYTEIIDTISFTSEYEYILERTLTVIDWCLYDETNGSEGLYTGSHIISQIDETPPLAGCFSFAGSYFPSEFPITLEADRFDWVSFDYCTDHADLRFTFYDIPPELDPTFDSTINASIREIHLDEFDGNSLLVDMYVWDPSGNFSFCSLPIHLKPEIVPEECIEPTYTLVDSRNIWKTSYFSRLRFKPDSILIDTKYYKQLENASASNNEWNDLSLYMSECDGKLFGRKNNVTTLYFDFNLEVGDTLFSDQYIGDVDLRIDTITDVTYYDGSIRKTLTVEALNGYGYFDMIEGIGSTTFSLLEFENVGQLDFDKEVRCFTVDDEIVYTDFTQFGCYQGENETCPYDLTLNCDQDYTDLSLTGNVFFNGNSEFDSISAITYTPNIDACGVGTVVIEHNVEDSLLCTQIITIINPFNDFDPSSIAFPADTIYESCNFDNFEAPEFNIAACHFMGFTSDLDTIIYNADWDYTVNREMTLINWCLYDETNGADGLYSASQEITVIDEESPAPFCLPLYEIGESQFPFTLEARLFNLGTYDSCTPNDSLRFTFSDIPPENDPEYNILTRTSSKTLGSEEFDDGPFFQDIYFWDLAGNSQYCSVSLSVTDDCISSQYTLVDPNNQWNVTTISGPNFTTSKQRFRSDEISFQGRKYFQIESANEENSNEWIFLPLYMRECNGRLYGRKNALTSEQLYFDFNLEVGDTLHSEQYIGEADLRIESITDVEYMDGSIRKTFLVEALNGFGYFEMIEGIGSTIFPLTEYENIAIIDYWNTLGCFTTNDEVVYIGDSFSSCWPVDVEDYLDENTVEIFPNPTSGLIQLTSGYSGLLVLYNSAGKELKTIRVLPGNNDINLSELASGVIIYSLSIGSEVQNGKLIKL